MYVIISYDITSSKRRTKVMKFLMDYGTRVQKSVFECFINEEQFFYIKKTIKTLINHRKDRVRYWEICNSCASKVEILGWGEIKEDDTFSII